MKALADYVHNIGFKFGIYTDRGTATCVGRPGSQGYETIDAQTYAKWGVDFVKEASATPCTIPAGKWNVREGTLSNPVQMQLYADGHALLMTSRRPTKGFVLCANGWQQLSRAVRQNAGRAERDRPPNALRAVRMVVILRTIRPRAGKQLESGLRC